MVVVEGKGIRVFDSAVMPAAVVPTPWNNTHRAASYSSTDRRVGLLAFLPLFSTESGLKRLQYDEVAERLSMRTNI